MEGYLVVRPVPFSVPRVSPLVEGTTRRSDASDGTSLEEAVIPAQQYWLERQADTLLDGTFVEWVDG